MEEILYIYSRLPRINLLSPTTSKGDLKRCKKGNHNYRKENGKCIHCEKQGPEISIISSQV